VDAYDFISIAYAEGEGVEVDYAKALEWNGKARAAGSLVAIANLGDYYKDGHGVSRDLKRAREFYQEAIDKGFAEAKAGIEALDALEKAGATTAAK
jgi:TPR repeat protein